MAVRLNVLLVQSPRMSALQSDINADLAARLMGLSGLDLAIVRSLDPAQAAPSDRLLLSAMQNDVAVLDWCDADEMLLALSRMGVAGCRAAHQLDRDAAEAAPGQRRLYLVDLRRGDPPAEVVAALQAILESRRVVTVSLSLPAAARPATGSSAPNSSAPPYSAKNTAPDPAPTANGGNAPAAGKRHDDSDLDALVEGVNESQW